MLEAGVSISLIILLGASLGAWGLLRGPAQRRGEYALHLVVVVDSALTPTTAGARRLSKSRAWLIFDQMVNWLDTSHAWCL